MWEITRVEKVDEDSEAYIVTATEKNAVGEPTGYEVSVNWNESNGEDKLIERIKKAVDKLSKQVSREEQKLTGFSNLDLSECEDIGI